MEIENIAICKNCGVIYLYDKADVVSCKVCGMKRKIEFDSDGKIKRTTEWYTSKEIMIDF